KLDTDEHTVSRLTHKPNDEQFAQKQEEICHFIQDEGISEAALQTLVVQILQQNPDDLNYGEDEGAERQTSGMIPETRHERSRHVIWLDKGPVVRSKGPGQSHLSQTDDKVGTPEKEEDVVELQADQVFVVNRLSSVEGEKALGVGALRLHWTAREVLNQEKKKNKINK
uniref:Uncharacterized protein n=1 Tax=Seriola lalandi dorsalis TaxID=1841481 RepID=A0A3B4YFI3_SERLL